MEDKSLETPVHYQVLETMAAEFKMEVLEVLEMGVDKFKELEKVRPHSF
jgi:hypothetical protein